MYLFIFYFISDINYCQQTSFYGVLSGPALFANIQCEPQHDNTNKMTFADSEDSEQADLSRHWAHRSFGWFYNVQAYLFDARHDLVELGLA